MNDFTQKAAQLRAMAHPARLQILEMLRCGETCVCHIEQAIDKRQAYVSQQLMILREAGLVESRKDGLQVFYRLVDDQLLGILSELFGECRNEEVDVLEGFDCPSCSSVLITDIS